MRIPACTDLFEFLSESVNYFEYRDIKDEIEQRRKYRTYLHIINDKNYVLVMEWCKKRDDLPATLT